MLQYIFSKYLAAEMVFLFVSEASFYVNTMYYSPLISHLLTLYDPMELTMQTTEYVQQEKIVLMSKELNHWQRKVVDSTLIQ